MLPQVTAVILTHNDQDTIDRCLESVDSFQNIIVLDDYSTDKTLELVSKHKARIYRKSLQDNFSKQRNYALSLVKTEWAFFIDADEVASPELFDEIALALQKSNYNAYFIPRIDIVFGKKVRFGELLDFSLVRLGKVVTGKWVGNVHEVWEVHGSVGRLSSPLLHYPQGGTDVFLRKVNFYSTIRAHELYNKGVRSGFLTILLFPQAKFTYTYVLKLGFLDGMYGIINAIGMSFYTFLVRSKLWFLWHEKKE